MIQTRTIIWATGVVGPSLADMLDVELSRGKRVPVHKTMEVIGRDTIYAAGDMVYLPQPGTDQPYPPLIPVAQQQGELVAKNILNVMQNKAQEAFDYTDRGTMATIGRSRAVAWVFKRFKLTGFLAWLAWLGLHLLELMGFRNRIQAFVNWVYDYVFYNRSVRFIIGDKPDKQTSIEMPDAVRPDETRKQTRTDTEAA
jgi:NADH dehydrogenase